MRQRAHISRLTQGDQPTFFFSRAIKLRQMKNSITMTLEASCRPTATLKEIKTRVVQHLTQLYNGDPCPLQILDLNIGSAMRVNLEVNAWLRHYPLGNEIRDTFFRFEHNKAPGLDGLPLDFLVRHWSIVKGKIIAVVLYFFLHGIMYKPLNHTCYFDIEEGGIFHAKKLYAHLMCMFSLQAHIEDLSE